MFTPQAPVGSPPMGLPLGTQLFTPDAAQRHVQEQPQQSELPPEVDFDRSINYLADYSGCGHWRMIWPEHTLNAHQKAVIHSTTMMVLDERYYQNTQTVRLQRQATEQQLEFIKLLKNFQTRQKFNIVYEIDDIVFHEDIPDYNKFKVAFVDPKIRDTARAIMQEVNEITVTNKFMKDYYMSKTGNTHITVIPNYPPKWWMGNFYNRADIERKYHKNRKKPRVAYCASGAHFDVENRTNQRDDFFHVNQAIANTVDIIQWVFVGAFPLPLRHFVEQGKIEFHPWQRLYEYPALLDKLNINMFIAPLANNTFNKAKSDLKHVEACCYGLPIACQDLCTYQDAPIRFTTGDEMIDQIRTTMKYKTGYMKASDAGRAVADQRWLELDHNIDQYVEMYKFPYGSSERKILNSLACNK